MIAICKKSLVLGLFLLIFSGLIGQPVSYYLPGDIDYKPDIPSPEELLGYPLGKWHSSHDQIVNYMSSLAQVSERVQIERFAYTYEDRPLLLLKISSPSNLNKLADLQKQHLQLCNATSSVDMDLEDMPVILYMGYSIHGNEPSGSHAAMLLSYYLAAAQGKAIDSLLNECIILIDPSLNPDGLNRFASWVNMHKSENLVEDKNNREHKEMWPSGRTNHYWFDLNRDWLPVQHPESQGRIANFYKWQPNILCDFHEMGTNATYFFQPGIPSRTNPLTPDRNQELTAQIALYYVDALDQLGSFYYTKESFDDYYFGKGSTYPDINGAVGILFEQASSRGHLQESANGLLSFPFTIKNQFATSLATLLAAQKMRPELLAYQRQFYLDAEKESRADNIKAYITQEEDLSRLNEFLRILSQHDIVSYRLKKDIEINGNFFRSEKSALIPLEQRQYRLLKALFDIRTTFKDSVFYDVSSWTLPLAFNLSYEAITKAHWKNDIIGDQNEDQGLPCEGRVVGAANEKAYVFSWNQYFAPGALNKILEMGLIAKVATKGLVIKVVNEEISLEAGSILVPVQNQNLEKDSLIQFMKLLADKYQVKIIKVNTSLSRKGVDLGSPTFKRIYQKKIGLFTGTGVSAYEAGEVWHLLDKRYDIKISQIDIDRLKLIDLENYDVFVMVDGTYSSITKVVSDRLKEWVNKGGTIIGQKRAIKWLAENELAQLTIKTSPKPPDSLWAEPKSYAMLSNERGSLKIGGAIFNVQMDTTHPIAFGYKQSELAIFRNSEIFLDKPSNPYSAPLYYGEDPLISGYIADQNLSMLENTAAVIVSGSGKGRVICFTDNPNFRAFWYGTNRLFVNALFFGSIIDARSIEKIKPSKTD